MADETERVKGIRKKIERAFDALSDVRVILMDYNSKILAMEEKREDIDLRLLDFLEPRMDNLIQAQTEIAK